MVQGGFSQRSSFSLLLPESSSQLSGHAGGPWLGHQVKERGGCTLWKQVLKQAEWYPPPTQVLHFFVGFGALLSPLIADPFLSEANCFPANSTANATSRSHLFHASPELGQHHAATQTIPRLPPKDSTENHVSYAFWIMALINVSVTDAGRVRSWGTMHASQFSFLAQNLQTQETCQGPRCAVKREK